MKYNNCTAYTNNCLCEKEVGNTSALKELLCKLNVMLWDTLVALKI